VRSSKSCDSGEWVTEPVAYPPGPDPVPSRYASFCGGGAPRWALPCHGTSAARVMLVVSFACHSESAKA